MKASAYHLPMVVAELCANHGGSVANAKRMVRMADICGVNVVKLQKRDIESQAAMYPALYSGPHPNPMHAFGPTYRAHREALEFDLEQHEELKEYIEKYEMVYSTSVWDLESAKQIVGLKPAIIKIPSACNGDRQLAAYLRDNFDGDLHVSLGMTSREEEKALLAWWSGDWHRIVLYHCTSEYPMYAEDAYLLELDRLLNTWPVKAVGFSNHHSGISLDMSAQALGAQWFEHHITLDRMAKGTDNIAALEFVDLRNLVRDLGDGFRGLRHRTERFSVREAEQRAKLKEGRTS